MIKNQFLEVSDVCTEPLELLKVLLDLKAVHPDVYDIMERVKELMLQS
jgi:hypothetical protein